VTLRRFEVSLTGLGDLQMRLVWEYGGRRSFRSSRFWAASCDDIEVSGDVLGGLETFVGFGDRQMRVVAKYGGRRSSVSSWFGSKVA